MLKYRDYEIVKLSSFESSLSGYAYIGTHPTMPDAWGRTISESKSRINDEYEEESEV